MPRPLCLLMLALASLSFCLQAGDPKPGAVSIEFSRSLKPGAEFDCEIKTECSRRCSLSMAGVDAPAVKSESSAAFLAGAMRIVEVNEAGNASRVELNLKAFAGRVDGKDFDFRELCGKPIAADLSKRPCSFEFKSQADGKLPPQAAALLGTAFRQSAKSGLKELMDPGRPVAVGESWTPPLKLLLESLRQRGAKFEEKDIDAQVTLKGKESIGGIECWQIEEQIQPKAAQGFDFKLAISILLPCDPSKGGALKISRSGTEIVSKPMPEENPLSAGKSVELITKDRLEATLLPLPAAK